MSLEQTGHAPATSGVDFESVAPTTSNTVN